jgi:hypothetical protein
VKLFGPGGQKAAFPRQENCYAIQGATHSLVLKPSIRRAIEINHEGRLTRIIHEGNGIQGKFDPEGWTNARTSIAAATVGENLFKSHRFETAFVKYAGED